MLRLLIVTMAILILPTALTAQGISLGIGVSGGLNLPIAQQDQGSGTAFGVRGIVKALPMITLEPNVFFGKYGEPTIEGVNSIGLDGSKITSYGIDARLGAPMGVPGFSPYALVGMGFYKAKRDQTAMFEDESTDFGWSIGLGVGLNLPSNIGVDLRGRFNLIPVDGGSSKKSLFVVGGLNYYFGGN
ncbi:MAG: porin family protein [candidate division Zixibacteria bacterium]|nr:porin family protein [candidate division Zixibacteria bacterium]